MEPLSLSQFSSSLSSFLPSFPCLLISSGGHKQHKKAHSRFSFVASVRSLFFTPFPLVRACSTVCVPSLPCSCHGVSTSAGRLRTRARLEWTERSA